jgi:shikimate kinase
MLAQRIGFTFFDVDESVQEYYQKPIERIQDECITMNIFRERASVVLDQLFSKKIDSVVAGTPAGLMSAYLSVYKKHKREKDLYSIHLYDSAENIVDRLTFFDKDSNPIIEPMDDAKRMRYLYEVREDYNYFRESYKRADFQINIEHIELGDIPEKIIEELNKQKIGFR